MLVLECGELLAQNKILKSEFPPCPENRSQGANDDS
jgi:hypothetical protein